MTYTEVLELIRAGYTKDEIEALMADEAKTRPVTPEPSKEKEETSPEPTQEKEAHSPNPPKPSEPSETEKLVQALGMKFDALTSALQAKNVGSIEGTNNQTTTDDIIARIINPKAEV